MYVKQQQFLTLRWTPKFCIGRKENLPSMFLSLSTHSDNMFVLYQLQVVRLIKRPSRIKMTIEKTTLNYLSVGVTKVSAFFENKSSRTIPDY